MWCHKRRGVHFYLKRSISQFNPMSLQWSSITFIHLIAALTHWITLWNHCTKVNKLCTVYTLSRLKNDSDVTEHSPGYMLQYASFMRQSRCSFLNLWESTQVARTITSVFLRNTHWGHSRSRGETKYVEHYVLCALCAMWMKHVVDS